MCNITHGANPGIRQLLCMYYGGTKFSSQSVPACRRRRRGQQEFPFRALHNAQMGGGHSVRDASRAWRVVPCDISKSLPPAASATSSSRNNVD
jgi:hypothetical protein